MPQNQATQASLTAHGLHNKSCLVDNLFVELWKQIGMKTLLARAGFKKRSGTPISDLVYLLMLWTWLKVDSIGMFARESLKAFSFAQKDALYGLMNREDLNWRRLHYQLAMQAVRSIKAKRESSAFVLDDSIKMRSGKRMPGVSSHFDHTSGRCVMGQQVLTLALSSPEGFVPLDNELYISKVKIQALNEPFKDGRSVVAKRHKAALQQTKPEMARDMIRRAMAFGIQALYLLADSWFGTKTMIRTALESGLIPILRMKKNAMKYRVTECEEGKSTTKEMDIKKIYQTCVRKQWEKIPGQRYEARAVDVELNLNEAKETPNWKKVRLLFVRSQDKQTNLLAGKHQWAVFLTTDTEMMPDRILELYAMRWAIEVYFKEAKQHLGFLKEQSTHYAAYVASIHLTSMRFCFLVIAQASHPEDKICDMRQLLSTNLNMITSAVQMWQVFRLVINGALNELKTLLGGNTDLVMEAIDQHVKNFFVQSLQLDELTLRLESQ